MDNKELNHLHYIQIPYEFILGASESLEAEELGWLWGAYALALMNGESPPDVPPTFNRAIHGARRQLEGLINAGWGKWIKARESGSKGGKKKAENAKIKAEQSKENGIYVPPKITPFKEMCIEVLTRYGNQKEDGINRYYLKLTNENRKYLYENLKKNNWTYAHERITNNDMLKMVILVEALKNVEENYFGDLIELFRGLIKRDIYLVGEFAELLSYFSGGVWEYCDVEYKNCEEFLDSYYSEDEEDELKYD